MTTIDLNEIISVFLQRNINELTLFDVTNAIEANGKSLSTAEIEHVVRSLGSSLFQIRANSNGVVFIRVNPTIAICKVFLDAKCPLQRGGCNQLHVCRFFDRCKKKDCHFPHNLKTGYNRLIVQQANCENIDPIRLIRLLRLSQFPHGSFKKSTAPQVVQKPTNKPSPPIQPKYNERVFERSDSSFSRRASQNSICSSATDRDDVTPSPSCISKVDTSRSLDICFAPTSTGRFVNIEKIELFLNQQNLQIREMFHLRENKCFQRWTLQFATDNAVAYLLARPVIPYESIHLKFKRSKPMIDRKSFVLKSIINSKRGPITTEKFSIYIDTLINHCLYQLTDLSSQFEQILLVQCNQMIDFDLLFRVQKSRRQLQGRDVSLKQVYELETAVIECIHTSLSNEIVCNIIKAVIRDVFEFNIVSNHCAFVEFLNGDILQQWLSCSEINKQKFGVNIQYNIKCVEKDDFVASDRNASRTSSIAQSTEVKAESMSSQTRIHIRRVEAMIANHPTFSIEYKNYIRSELGYEIDIRGNQIQIHLDTTSDCLPKEHSLELLTSKFMEKFVFRSVSLQEPMEQLNILRAHSTTVAFCCVKDNKYLLVTKKSNVHTFMQKLFPNKSRNRRRANPRPSATSTVQRVIESEDEQPLVPFWNLPAPNNSLSANDRYLPTMEITTKSVELSLETLAQTTFFADETFKDRLRTYFDDTHSVKIKFGPTTESRTTCMVKLIGEQDSIDKAYKELLNLCSLMRTMTFDKTIDLSWTKIKDAACVIQHQLSSYNIIYVCQQLTSPKSIVVHHVDKKHREFGVDEQIIETVCRKKLVQATCIHMLPTRFETEWTTLKTTILQRADYGKDICLFYERPIISLFGLPQIVNDLQQKFDSIKMKDKKIENSFHDTKSQPNYSPSVVESKLKQSQKLSTAVGDNLNVKYSVSNSTTSTTVRDRPNLTTSTIVCDRPKVVSNSMKENDQKRSITFDVDEPGFEVLVKTKYSQFLAIVDSKCSIESQIINRKIQIQIPKARVTDFNDNTSEMYSQETYTESVDNSNEASANSTSNWFLDLFRSKKPSTQQSKSAQQPTLTPQIPSASSSNDTNSVTIGKSKIIVCSGDLTKQAVDIIVVCSTSKILCDKIIFAAGPLVESVFDQQLSSDSLAFEIGGGNLPCKKIVFLPWSSSTSHPQMLKQSIATFVASAITHAIDEKCTTIAFPSIGCGQLGHDPKSIAEYMIGETYRQLKSSLLSPLIVSFVLLPEQQNVFQAFADQLNRIQSIDDTPPSIFLDKQTVKITLTGADNNALIECQDKINILARSCSTKLDLADSNDIADWSQASIQKYYEYCLVRRVIPTLDIQKRVVSLFGPKNAVSEAEKYFYQLNTETLRNARIQVISRGFIWSVEVSPGKWEQYPYRVSQQIEDAQVNRLSFVEFTNEKSERCRVNFSTMEEQYQKRKRKIDRKRIDSSLPNNWDLSGGSFKRVTLSNPSTEYKGVINQFDMTMKGHYSKIIKIERIQNERWYKQYAAHRDEFQQRYTKPDERLLFHGCNSIAADKIVQECFNRAFAGANGIAYGCGVYFHEHAKYSHSYTRPGALGERRMFLARVLIGKTCVGNPSMKVPPEGFDTTTDGGHIFVVYHDAGAYGEYLLTYI